MNIIHAFSGTSVLDAGKAHKFYAETLGLKVTDNGMGLEVHLPDGNRHFLYAKDDHEPATFTVLNFVVADIDKAVTTLTERGVKMLRYENFHQDEHGIMRGLGVGRGPDIAWFADPSGNILSVLQTADEK